MATIYCFFNIHSSSEGSYCMMDEKNIDPITIEWIKNNNKMPDTLQNVLDTRDNGEPEYTVDYVPLNDEFLINDGVHSDFNEFSMEGVAKIIPIITSTQYD